LETDLRTLVPRAPWDRVSPGLWLNARWAVEPDALAGPLPEVVMGCGGAGARVAAALRRADVKVVAIQHPRMRLNKFDLVMAARHDGITGDNVIVTRTALHRVTPKRRYGPRGLPGSTARWWRCCWAGAMGATGWRRRWRWNWRSS
jgi:uncharacterized protein